MQLELERGDDPEVAAPAAQAPEEVGVLLLARNDELTVGGDDIAREQVVDREAELPHHVADASAERQAGDSRVADDAAGDTEPERLALAIDVRIETATFNTDRPGERVNASAGHE
jgi:hypothetical protein